MTRKALLIGGTYGDLLPGALRDIAEWKDFFQSSVGGCWLSGEIEDLTGLSRDQILAKVNAARNVDYAVVAFSGHGCCNKDKYGFDITSVEIQDNVFVSERELNPGNDRCLMVLDCCRGPFESALVNESFAEDAADMLADDEGIRRFYETVIDGCEKGVCRVYATERGHFADDVRSFSSVLLRSVKEHAGGALTGVVRIDEAVEMVRKDMDPQQQPEYRGGRRLAHFPFAVNPGIVRNLNLMMRR